jgi:hypothetical protein
MKKTLNDLNYPRDRESFVVYTEYLANIEQLSMEDRGALFTALLCYAKGEDVPKMSPMAAVTFSFIRQDLDRAYAKRMANKINGEKGGRPPKTTVGEPTGDLNGLKTTQINPNKPKITEDNPTKPSHNLNVDVNGDVDVDDIKEKERSLSIDERANAKLEQRIAEGDFNGNDYWLRIHRLAMIRREIEIEAEGDAYWEDIDDNDYAYEIYNYDLHDAGRYAIKKHLIEIGVLHENEADNPPGLDDTCWKLIREKMRLYWTDEQWEEHKKLIETIVGSPLITTRENMLIRCLCMQPDRY